MVRYSLHFHLYIPVSRFPFFTSSTSAETPGDSCLVIDGQSFTSSHRMGKVKRVHHSYIRKQKHDAPTSYWFQFIFPIRELPRRRFKAGAWDRVKNRARRQIMEFRHQPSLTRDKENRPHHPKAFGDTVVECCRPSFGQGR